MTTITQESCHSVVQVHDNVDAVKLYSKVYGGTLYFLVPFLSPPFLFSPPLLLPPTLSVNHPCNVYWHVTAPYKLSFIIIIIIIITSEHQNMETAFKEILTTENWVKTEMSEKWLLRSEYEMSGLSLNIWRQLLPYGYLNVRVPECQKLQMTA